jgi:hypothetical protein
MALGSQNVRSDLSLHISSLTSRSILFVDGLLLFCQMLLLILSQEFVIVREEWEQVIVTGA